MLDRSLGRTAGLLACPLFLLAAGLAQSADAPHKTVRADIASIRKQAEAGDPEAQTKLGMAYHKGDGVTADDWKAAEWFRKAADLGDARAANSLGILYQNGHGVPKDLGQAFAWFKKAASQRYAPAVFSVATSYYNGDGVPEDMVAAYAWMLMADELGEQAAHDAVERTAAELGGRTTEGEFTLAQILDDGVEVPKNEAGAARWYRVAGGHGNAEAQTKYGLMLADGRGVARNPGEAFQWLQRAAEQKYGPAMFSLGYAYQKGTLGQHVDVRQAITWYEGAAAAGHPGAMVNLGLMNADGTTGEPNYQKAYFWLYMADAYNIPEAKDSMPMVTAHLSQKQVAEAQQSLEAWWRKNPRPLLVKRPDPRQPVLVRKDSDGQPPLSQDLPQQSALPEGVFRIGGDVLPPRPIFSPEPEFDPISRKHRTSGTAVLRCVVGADGTTRDIQVVQSLTPELDEQSIATLKQWRFSPATKEGQPVPVVVKIEFNFKMFR